MFSIHGLEIKTEDYKQFISSYFNNHIKQGEITFGKNDKVMVSQVEGLAKKSKKNRYMIGSISKQFTAVGLLKVLYEKYCDKSMRKFNKCLHKPISKFLPKTDPVWKGKMPSWANKVTIHHLLSNSSGLRDNFNGWDDLGIEYMVSLFKKNDDFDTVSEFSLIGQKLQFKPGSKLLYSSTNFFLAGVIAERILKGSLADYLQKNVFSKCNMKDTFMVKTGKVSSIVK